MYRNQLIAIYKHTIDYCIKKRFPVYKPIKYQYDLEDFNDNKILSTQMANLDPTDQPKIFVENIDSFDMAIKMGKDNILILNLASSKKSGGGVINGAKAQEEDLYRKSNYFEANNQNMYPLDVFDVVYSPSVHIIKNSSYKLLNQSYRVSCLAVAAIHNPKLILSDELELVYGRKIDMEIMQNKIDMIFKVAIKHGHKYLVLGALGCGVFHNPPKVVADMFKKSLDKYANYFDMIVFAILSTQSNDNYNIFKDILCK